MLKTTAIQAGKFEENANKRLPETLKPRPELEVVSGDLLITCAGPRARCGVPTLVRKSRPGLLLSGKMYRFRTIPDVDPRFLEYYLLSSSAQAEIDKMKTGINESGLNLTKSRFLALPVPIAPLAEQRRIVEILEDHLSRIDAAMGYLHASIRRCSHLIESWLRDSLQPVAGENRRLADLIVESRGGWSRSRGHLVAKTEGTPYLKMNNIARTGDLVLDDVVNVVATEADLSKYQIRSGDVLFNSKNSGDLIGKAAVADQRVAGWVFNENIMRLRFDDVVSPEYAGLWFLGRQARTQIRKNASASTNVAAVYFRALKDFEMWVPGMDVQERLVAEYLERRSAADRLRNEVEAQLRSSERLRHSILVAAFSGKLTDSALDVERVEEMAGV
ncbi:restriction endonuclease subunit S [Micrococcus sp. GPGPB33]|uniref:restriction endonuclease subunit S n=1 Tax=Micrococcus sp. GPGPB33 TaxID=3023084 RepID=UPI0030BE4C17|nr:restriction endonuclease subunit S [Micrococcus luteus]